MTPKLHSLTVAAARRARPAVGLLAAVSLLAAACGGSSPTAPDGPAAAESVEAASMALVNEARRDGGLGQLAFDPVLCEVARAHSRQMRDEGFVSHFDSSGGAVDGRLRSYGVRFTMAGENIATLGDTTDPAGDAHRGFMGSTPHRANILEGRYTSVGVGVATNGDQYWITQVFIRE